MPDLFDAPDPYDERARLLFAVEQAGSRLEPHELDAIMPAPNRVEAPYLFGLMRRATAERMAVALNGGPSFTNAESRAWYARLAVRALETCAEILSEARAFVPTHRHRKGGLYRVVARGRLERDLAPVVIYASPEGLVWVRPAAEFDDGRFAPLTDDEAHAAAVRRTTRADARSEGGR